MDLQELKFVINTDDVKKAVGDLQQLSTAVEKLNKPVEDLGKKSKQVTQAQENIATAANEAATASNEAATASNGVGKAAEGATTRLKSLEKLLNRLGTLYTDLAQGSTKWESSILTSARNLGASETQLKPFMDMLEKIRGLSKDPFDSAIGSVRSITQELDALTNRSKLAEQGIFLTNKQLSEYSRIANEIKGKISAGGLDPNSGKGLEEFNRKLQDQQHLYLVNAQAVNAQKEAEKLRNKEAKAALEAQAAAQKELEQAERQAQNYRMKAWSDSVGQRSLELDAMRNYYTELERNSKQAAIAEAKAMKEQTVAGYLTQGVSKSAATTAANMQMRGVPQEAIDSYLREAKAKDEAARAARGLAAANAYVANEDAKLAAALDSVNASLNKTSTDALVRYKNALAKTGMTAEEQVVKLEEYKKKIEQVQKASSNRQVDYLSRALGPQITDIVTGLATGQSPMMVLLQQGGQLRDQFALAGVAGKEMGNMLAVAAKSMVTSVKDVTIAVGGLFTSMAKGAVGSVAEAFVAPFKRLSEGRDALKMLESGMISQERYNRILEVANGRLLQSFGALSSLITGGLVVAFAVYAIALKQVIDQESEASKTAAMYGGSLGLTQNKILDLSKAYAGSKENIGTYISAINEAAKSGYISADSLEQVVKAAVALEKVGGQSVKETMKQFSDLGEKPAESLAKLAQQMGTIPPEILKQVYALEKQKKITEAATLAQEAYAKAVKEAANTVRDDMGALETLFNGLKSSAKSMWDAILNIGRKDTTMDRYKEYAQKLQMAMKGEYDVGMKFETFGRNREESIAYYQEILDSLSKQLTAEQKVAAEKQKNSEAARQIRADMNKQGSGFSNQTDNVLSTEQKIYDSLMKKAESFNKDKLSVNKLYFELGIKDRETYLSEEERLIRESETQRLSLLDNFNTRTYEIEQDTLSKLKKEYERANKERPDLADENTKKYKEQVDNVTRSYAALRETLSDTREKIVSTADARSIASMSALKDTVANSKKTYEDFIKTQADLLSKQQEEIRMNDMLVGLNDAQAVALRARTKAYNDMIPVISQLKKTADEAARALIEIEFNPNATGEQILAARAIAANTKNRYQTALAQQPGLAEAAGTVAVTDLAIKKQEEVKKAYEDFTKAQQDTIEKRKEEIDLQTKLIGKSPEDVARITAQSNAYNAMIPVISELQKKVNEAKAALTEVEFDPNATGDQILAARKAVEKATSTLAKARIDQTVYAEKAGIDAVVAYHQQEWTKETDRLKSTLVDALMAGGKRGADMIRNYLREQLVKKPLTVMIDAVVNNISGSFMNNLMGGSASGSLGTNASGAMSTLGNVGSFFSALNSSVSNGIASSFGKLATSSFGQNLGLSSVDPASGITGLTNTGAMLSKGLQMGGSALAGYGLSKAIGSGYKTGMGDLVDIAGTIASAFFGPIGGVVSGLVNRAFGTKLKDVGIQGTFGGDQGFAGNTFQFMKGGWFRNDKTKLGTLDSGIQRSLGEQFNAFRTQIATLATSVGEQTDALVNYTQEIKISTMGLSEDQIQQKLADEFKKVQEGMAKLIITTDEYSAGNETALETLTRLSSALTTTNAAFDLLGYKLYDVSLAGADAAQALVDAFGGLDSLKEVLSYFYENFYSETERLSVSTRQMTKAFADLGYELPSSKDAFRALVDTIQATGDNTKLAGVLNLAKGFNELDAAITQVSSSVVDEVKRLRGVSTTGGNLASLESQFAILTAQARAGDTSALNKLPEFTQAIEEAVKLTATSSMDVAFTRARLATSLTDTLTALGLNVPTFAAGGDHAGGLRIVGENGPELEATGPSRIFSAEQTASMLSGNGGNETLLQVLIGEVQLLRAEVRADVAANSKTSRILDRVVQDGETVSISGTLDGGVV